MYLAVVAAHVVLCVFLVLIIILQPGKGGDVFQLSQYRFNLSAHRAPACSAARWLAPRPSREKPRYSCACDQHCALMFDTAPPGSPIRAEPRDAELQKTMLINPMPALSTIWIVRAPGGP